MAKAAKTFYEVTEDMAYKAGFTSDKSILQRRKEKARDKARQAAAEAKRQARKNLAALPDERAQKLAARKASARKRAMRSGRRSTILSNNQTLG